MIPPVRTLEVSIKESLKEWQNRQKKRPETSDSAHNRKRFARISAQVLS